MIRKFYIILFIFFSCTSVTANDYDVSLEKIESEVKVLDEWKGTTQYWPINLIDNDFATCFAEGRSQQNRIVIDFDFAKTISIDEIRIYNGYWKSKELYTYNNRIDEFQLILSNDSIVLNKRISLEDKKEVQIVKFEEKKIKSVYISTRKIYNGTKFDDTCISEIKFFYKGREIKTNNIEELKKQYIDTLKSDLQYSFADKKYVVGDKLANVHFKKDGTIVFWGEEEDDPEYSMGSLVKPTHWKIDEFKLFMKVNGKWELVDYALKSSNKEERPDAMYIHKIGNYPFEKNLYQFD